MDNTIQNDTNEETEKILDEMRAAGLSDEDILNRLKEMHAHDDSGQDDNSHDNQFEKYLDDKYKDIVKKTNELLDPDNKELDRKIAIHMAKYLND